MRLQVKDWFHEKKMNENERNIQNNDVFAIIKESEKAMYVMTVDVAHGVMTYWCPKSCIIEVPEIDDYMKVHKDALKDISYEEALEMAKIEISLYR